MGGGSQKSDQVLIHNPIVHPHVGGQQTLSVRCANVQRWWFKPPRGQTMPGGYYVRSMEEAHRQTMRVDTLEPRCGKFQKKTPSLRMAQSDREPLEKSSYAAGKGFRCFCMYLRDSPSVFFFRSGNGWTSQIAYNKFLYQPSMWIFPAFVMLKKMNACCFVIPKKRNQPAMLLGSWTPKKDRFRKPSD